jgi:acetyl esterase/lipase
VPLFPEAAFPADTPAASENRTGLYLESNGIFSMVRNLVTDADDVRHPYLTPMNAESHADLPPAILVTNGYDPLRDVSGCEQGLQGSDASIGNDGNVDTADDGRPTGWPEPPRQRGCCTSQDV